MLAADRAQQVIELGAFIVVQPGGRLVEAQQHRVGAHGAGDFEPALRAVGQGAGRIVGALREPDAIVQRFGAEFEKLVLIALMEDWDDEFGAGDAAATLARGLSAA